MEQPIAAKTGRELSSVIYNEVFSEGYQLRVAKSPRQEFIKRAMAEAGLTEKGAATYYVGFRRVAKGLSMFYPVKKKSEDAGKTFVDLSAAFNNMAGSTPDVE